MLLRVVFADETAIAQYEVIEEGSSYRTWCVHRRDGSQSNGSS
jgi:hypothetical protein